MRKDNPQSMSAEDLHILLVVARYVECTANHSETVQKRSSVKAFHKNKEEICERSHREANNHFEGAKEFKRGEGTRGTAVNHIKSYVEQFFRYGRMDINENVKSSTKKI